MKSKLISVLAAVFFFIIAKPLLAANNGDSEINWFMLIAELLGGLSLFLYGMDLMSKGLKKSAGDRMRSIIARLTNNRFIGMLVGTFVTVVIQSSSATTVMLVSFVQSGLMSFAQSLGIILGANIGTTFTAQIIAFKLTNYAILMIAIGFGMSTLIKKESIKTIGQTLLGFGILFFGMKLMSDAMYPLRSYDGFISMLENLENPVLGIIAGALFTALIQSSSAFTGIIIVLAEQNLITIEAGIPLIMGANIGTCVTAGLASIGASREAKRVSIAHTFFNFGGALLFVFFIPHLTDLINYIAQHTGSGMARKIANAHTIFNFSTAIIFIPFTGLIAKLIMKILPLKPEAGYLLKVKFLHETQTPTIALYQARAEIARITENTYYMLKAAIEPFISDNWKDKQDEVYPELSLLQGINMRENKVDYLEEQVLDYLFKIGKGQMQKEIVNEMSVLIAIVNDLESIADIVHRNILPQLDKHKNLKHDFSTAGRTEIIDFHAKMCKQLSRIKDALRQETLSGMKKVIKKGEKYTKLETEYRKKHIKRLNEGKIETIATHEIHMELMDMLKQINIYCGNIGKTIETLTKTTEETQEDAQPPNQQ